MTTHPTVQVRHRLMAGLWLLMFICVDLAISAEPVSAATAAAKPAAVRGGHWYLRNSLTSGTADAVFVYGRSEDFPLFGDWDGDGTKTPGVVQGNTWHLRNSNSPGFGEVIFKYGIDGDYPIAGDWDGDGVDTPGVFRTHVKCIADSCQIGLNTWHLRNTNSAGVAETTFSFGLPGLPLSGDWNGDGTDGVGVVGVASNRWDLTNGFDSTADTTLNYGHAGDYPIVGDWDGDGADSVGVVQWNTWRLRNSNTSGVAETSFSYGSATDAFLVWQ